MKQEIILLLIGGGIAIVSSVVTLLGTYFIERQGKIKIYTKIVCSKVDGGGWGCRMTDEGLSFHIPLWIEILNTSNAVQVVRNFNLAVFYNKKEIALMTQINQIGNDEIANKGAYSFVLEPRSIQKYDCHFTIKRDSLKDVAEFNEIKAVFYDSRDKRHLYDIKKVDNCWSRNKGKPDNDWRLLV